MAKTSRSFEQDPVALTMGYRDGDFIQSGTPAIDRTLPVEEAREVVGEVMEKLRLSGEHQRIEAVMGEIQTRAGRTLAEAEAIRSATSQLQMGARLLAGVRAGVLTEGQIETEEEKVALRRAQHVSNWNIPPFLKTRFIERQAVSSLSKTQRSQFRGIQDED